MPPADINIWDDYYEDGYVPDGELQETYAYVETSKVKQDKQKVYLEELMRLIVDQKLLPETVEMTIVDYDSATKYPNLIGTESAYLLYRRWELRFKHLTHELRENLVEKLQKYSSRFVVYSES